MTPPSIYNNMQRQAQNCPNTHACSQDTHARIQTQSQNNRKQRTNPRTCRWKKPKVLRSLAVTSGMGSFRSEPVRTTASPTTFTILLCLLFDLLCLDEEEYLIDCFDREFGICRSMNDESRTSSVTVGRYNRKSKCQYHEFSHE